MGRQPTYGEISEKRQRQKSRHATRVKAARKQEPFKDKETHQQSLIEWPEAGT